MKLLKEDKNVLIYAVFLLITVLLFLLTLQINDRGKTFAESPKLLPLITEGCMVLISIGGLVENIVKKGNPSFGKIKQSFHNTIKSKESRKTLLAIAIVVLYTLCVIYISFYISSFILIAGVTIAYVKKLKIYWALFIAIGLTVILYLVFAVAFNMRLR